MSLHVSADYQETLKTISTSMPPLSQIKSYSESRNLYDILGAKMNDVPAEIKRKYVALAKKSHPIMISVASTMHSKLILEEVAAAYSFGSFGPNAATQGNFLSASCCKLDGNYLFLARWNGGMSCFFCTFYCRQAVFGFATSVWKSCLGAIRCPGSNLTLLKASEGIQVVDCKKTLWGAWNRLER